MKKKKLNGFTKNLSRIINNDEYRDNLQYVYFENGYAYASDAHVLIKQSLKLHIFTDEDIEILNGKCLHKKAFAMVYSADMVEVKEEHIKCVNGKTVYLVEYGKGVSPNFEKVFPEDINETKEIDRIGLNPSLLNKLYSIMFGVQATELRFFAKNKLIIVKCWGVDIKDEVGLIMPTMLD